YGRQTTSRGARRCPHRYRLPHILPYLDANDVSNDGYSDRISVQRDARGHPEPVVGGMAKAQRSTEGWTIDDGDASKKQSQRPSQSRRPRQIKSTLHPLSKEGSR